MMTSVRFVRRRDGHAIVVAPAPRQLVAANLITGLRRMNILIQSLSAGRGRNSTKDAARRLAESNPRQSARSRET